MAFQEFEYKVHELNGYVEYLKTKETYDYNNEVMLSNVHDGQLVTIDTELFFVNDTKEFMSKGSITYFLPTPEEDFYDFKYVVIELLYQSYCRQSGHIYSKYSEVPEFLPSVSKLYSEFRTVKGD